MTPNPVQTLKLALAYYRREYGPAIFEDMVEALDRVANRRDFVTLAEIRSLESVGLAYGYSVKAPEGAAMPYGPTARGREVISALLASS